MGFLITCTKATDAVSLSLNSLWIFSSLAINCIITLPYLHFFAPCRKGTYFRTNVTIRFVSGQMAWFISMFHLKPSHSLNSFVLPPQRLFDRHLSCWCHWEFTTECNRSRWPFNESIGYCSVAMSTLLTGANLGFLFLGEKKKQHSEKTEETQLNPSRLVFLVFFYWNHVSAELKRDSGIYFSKCKIGFLAIKCHVLLHCNELDQVLTMYFGNQTEESWKKL